MKNLLRVSAHDETSSLLTRDRAFGIVSQSKARYVHYCSFLLDAPAVGQHQSGSCHQSQKGKITGDRLKILLWERDGFLLWYKRLETGLFKLPRVQEGARSVELRASELAMVLGGIDVSKLKRVPRYTRISKDKDIALRDSLALRL